MTAPPDLLQAAAACSGRIVFVQGAGCSKEHPTNLLLASELARRCHDRLLANGHLQSGDCGNPEDLSLVADAVYQQHHTLEPMKAQFPPREFLAAGPNTGHKLAAALMRERAVAHLATLNFDLAQSAALTDVGARDVDQIDGQEDFQLFGDSCLVYLHRSIRAPADELILRTEQLDEDWPSTWRQAFAERVLSGPFTIFAGLGSPAGVLIESVSRIAEAVGDSSRVYIVDPVPPENSAFLTALTDRGIAVTYLQVGWSDFVQALADRVVHEQRLALEEACRQLVSEEDVGPLPETLEFPRMCEGLERLGLLGYGRFRATCLFGAHAPYTPFWQHDPKLIADLLIAAARLLELVDGELVLQDDGVMELRRGDTVVARVLLVSGGGVSGWQSVERTSLERLEALRHVYPVPKIAISGGINGPRTADPAPRDLVGESTPGDLIDPPLDVTIVETWEVHADADKVAGRIQP